MRFLPLCPLAALAKGDGFGPTSLADKPHQWTWLLTLHLTVPWYVGAAQ